MVRLRTELLTIDFDFLCTYPAAVHDMIQYVICKCFADPSTAQRFIEAAVALGGLAKVARNVYEDTFPWVDLARFIGFDAIELVQFNEDLCKQLLDIINWESVEQIYVSKSHVVAAEIALRNALYTVVNIDKHPDLGIVLPNELGQAIVRSTNWAFFLMARGYVYKWVTTRNVIEGWMEDWSEVDIDEAIERNIEKYVRYCRKYGIEPDIERARKKLREIIVSDYVLHLFRKAALKFIEVVPFEEVDKIEAKVVHICQSTWWVPPHLDPKFVEFVDMVRERSGKPYVTVEEYIDRSILWEYLKNKLRDVIYLDPQDVEDVVNSPRF